MKYNLFLDDVRKPSDVKWLDLPPVDWVIVRNYEDFKKTIKKAGLPSIVSFDHDLTPSHYEIYANSSFKGFDYSKIDKETGYHCAEFLIEFCKENKFKLPECHVHSMNVIGKYNIEKLLTSFKNVV